MTNVDPLFPHSGTLALSEHGDMQLPVYHSPGPLRPFSATLATALPPVSKKHDTVSTRSTTRIATQKSKDGKVVADSTPDVGTDS